MIRFATTLCAAALGLAACQGGGTSTGPAAASVRPTVETAPADLQLLCASEAATRFGVPSDRVLPVSSAATGGGVYQVDLTLGGGSATCLVDGNGSIVSLNRV
jgi:hypothetical protein